MARKKYTKWSEIKAGWTDERRARIDAAVAEETRKIRLLKTLREERGLTQVQLAELLEINQGSLSSLENRPNITLESLLRYIDALGGDLTLTVAWRDGGETKLAM